MSSNNTAESGAAIAAKLAPPSSVSLATIFGVPVPDIVLLATLIYTLLMIVHKLIVIYKDTLGERDKDD
jgi:hypothetical protein